MVGKGGKGVSIQVIEINNYIVACTKAKAGNGFSLLGIKKTRVNNNGRIAASKR